METAKLGKKGQVSIPKAVLERLGIQGEAVLAVEVTADGAILLRQVGIYPLEIYSDERLKEFAESDRITPEETRKLTRCASFSMPTSSSVPLSAPTVEPDRFSS